MTSPLIEPITTPRELTSLLRAIESAVEVCVDSEADSRFHYYEKLCLLQFTIVGTGGAEHFLLDPLAGLELHELLTALQEKPLVLHAADNDLRLLRLRFDFAPRLLFDTLIAAQFAGHAALGLDALVSRYAGREMDHGMQKADWSQRPLPPRFLKYAVEDTAHLPLIAQKLREELATLGRLEWHRQECAHLLKTCAKPSVEDADPWRIKGSFQFDRQCLAILRELWLWRDEHARTWDRPPYMVLSHEKLFELVDWAAGNIHGDLRHGPSLPPRWHPQRVRSLEKALQKAWAVPESAWPQHLPRGKRPPFDPHFSPRLTRLRRERDAVAAQLKLTPSLLATTATLEAIAARNPRKLEDFASVEDWLPWQTELLGEKFLHALRG